MTVFSHEPSVSPTQGETIVQKALLYLLLLFCCCLRGGLQWRKGTFVLFATTLHALYSLITATVYVLFTLNNIRKTKEKGNAV